MYLLIAWTGHPMLSQNQDFPTVPDGSIHSNQKLLVLGLADSGPLSGS